MIGGRIWAPLGLRTGGNTLGELRAVGGTAASGVWIYGSEGAYGAPDVIHRLVRVWTGGAWGVHDTTLAEGSLGGNYAGQGYDLYAADDTTVWICTNKAVARWNGSNWATELTIPEATHEYFAHFVGRGSADVDVAYQIFPSGIAHYQHWTGTAWGGKVDVALPGLGSAVVTQAASVNPTSLRVAVDAGSSGSGSQAAIVRATGTPAIEYRGVTGTTLRAIWLGSPTVGMAAGMQHMPVYETLGDPLIVTWDGMTWSSAPAPSYPAGTLVWYNALDGTSAHDLWLVGYTASRAGGDQTCVVEHWNGSNWTHQLLPGVITSPASSLNGVRARSATDVWVVGGSPHQYFVQASAYVAQWNGTTWTDYSGTF